MGREGFGPRTGSEGCERGGKPGRRPERSLRRPGPGGAGAGDCAPGPGAELGAGSAASWAAARRCVAAAPSRGSGGAGGGARSREIPGESMGRRVGRPAGPWGTPGSRAKTEPPPAGCVARSFGEGGAGSRGADGEREAQKGPKAAHHLLQLPAGRPAAPLPEGPVPGSARARRAGGAAGPHANTGQFGVIEIARLLGGPRGTPGLPRHYPA